MRLTADERGLVNDLMCEAHDAVRQPDGSYPTRRVAMWFVEHLRELDGAGHHWTVLYRDHLAYIGAAKLASDWRRKFQRPARTRKGTDLSVPAFVGVTEKGVAKQMAFASMDRAALAKHREKLARTRDTLSAEVRLVSDLLDVMDAGTALTAGEAMSVLLEKAAA